MKIVDRIAWGAVVAVVVMAVGTFAGIEWTRRTVLAARAAAEPWRETGKWRGTNLSSKIAVPQPVVTAFENDPPAPAERKSIFAAFLTPRSQYRCEGWFGTIDDVSPNVDGWEVSITIRIKLSGTAFQHTTVIEKWQVLKAGKARCAKCDIGSGPHFLTVD